MPAARKGTKQVESPKAKTASGDAMEERLLAFAEQLGTMVGTVQRQAEGWLDSEAVRSELSRIRDNASDLLEYVNSKAPSMLGAKGAKGARKRPARAAVAPAKARRRAKPPAVVRSTRPASGTVNRRRRNAATSGCTSRRDLRRRRPS
jgi:hypothetical protein